MPQERTRKIVITGIMGAIAIFLGATGWGFIPWVGGISLTIMMVPVIIGAVLEGPVVGAAIGLIFGIFSMIQAAVAPKSPGDVIFTNPLVAVLPRLLVGPGAWLVYRSLLRWPVAALIGAGAVGSLVNTVLVLGVIGLLGLAPWEVILPLIPVNGLPEAGAAALLVLTVVSAWHGISIGRRKSSSL